MKTMPVLLGILAAVAASLSFAGGASAFENTIPFTPGDPVANGCPAGTEAIRLSDFPSQYRAPARIDSASNGGNGDGIVCAKPWTAQEQAARLPDEDTLIFNFRDNTLTPAH
ncbi:MAG: hypothetical protein QOK34_605 [Gaiellaceae bacterium]|jgi:hypothetical protein|nr:hypothetical protein [Gaiellaceae bacterium]MDX6435771.1 hypothetical protein [Gaiellaceae bacterium]